MAPAIKKVRKGRKPHHKDRYVLEAQVGFVLRKASQRHAAIFARAMIDQITPTQWAALVKLREVGASSQNRLGRETAMDIATIKGVVDRLLARGLIKTSQDLEDGRRVTIRLTDAGARAVEKGVPIARRITEQTLRGLKAAERVALMKLLQKIS
jgi:MarR family transcriptional regulator, lower aerobic nicotinate degradation pathway regulator